jgi:hypothetical protein
VVPQQRADGERAQAEHGPYREVDVAGDHHHGLTDRQNGQDRGTEQDVADTLAGQEARIGDRGDRDQGGEREHDAQLPGSQDEVER